MGYSEIFVPPQKELCGATTNNTGEDTLKLGGLGKIQGGHTKFLGGLKKMEAQRFQGPVTEGCTFQGPVTEGCNSAVMIQL